MERFAECGADGSIPEERFRAQISDRTRIVAMTQVSNVLGREYPIRRFAEIAHEAGALFVCDGAQSVPVILCAEEDVVGNHGASIGRLDEGISYYLQTRGMTPEEVERMMARARLEAVIRKIPEEAVRNRLLETEEKDA